jgi:hypothetical protein
VGLAYFLAARLSLARLTQPDGVAMFWPAGGRSAATRLWHESHPRSHPARNRRQVNLVFAPDGLRYDNEIPVERTPTSVARKALSP